MTSRCNPMRRFRFSLSLLLVVTTAIALCVGYTQWRQRWMMREINALRAEGVIIELSPHWTNRIWLRLPRHAVVPLSADYDSVKPRLRKLGLREMMEASEVR